MPATKKKAKKTTTKAAAVKKPAKKRAVEPVSFKVCKEPNKFMTMRFTRDTLHWCILLALILALSLWVLSIQIDLYRIIDGIQ